MENAPPTNHPPPPPAARRGNGWLSFGLAVALVVGGVFLFVANLLVWLDRTVIDSQGFTDTAARTLDKPEMQERIATVVTTQVLQSDEYQRLIDENLPSQIAVVEPIIRARARPLIEDAVQAILASEVVGSARDTVLLRLHEQLMVVLEDRSQLVGFEDDRLVIDLNTQVDRVFERIGLDLPEALGGGENGQGILGDAGTVVLVEDARALRDVSWFIENRGAIFTVLLVGMVVSFAAVIALNPRIDRGVFRVGLTVLIVGVLTLLMIGGTDLALRLRMEDMIVLRDLVDEMVSNLRWQSFALILIGAIAIALADVRIRSRLEGAGGVATAAMQRVDPLVALGAVVILALLLLILL